MLHTEFKHLSQVILRKKIFEYFSTYFYAKPQDPLGRGHFESWVLCLNKLDLGPLSNVNTKTTTTGKNIL